MAGDRNAGREACSLHKHFPPGGHPTQYFGDGWGVIFAHPADFTPVCTTELGEVRSRSLCGRPEAGVFSPLVKAPLQVSKLVPDFAGVNCKILACSCDPVSVHQEWKKDIEVRPAAVAP